MNQEGQEGQEGQNGFRLRDSCKRCSGSDGRIEEKNGQAVVFCSGCGAYQYCAPKAEMGRAVRSVSTVHAAIKTNQRARIILRGNGRCELCGKPAERCKNGLHVGHLISVARGLEMGLTELELNDDENLAAICDECNLGMSDEPIPLRFAVAIALARLRRTNRDNEHGESS